MERYIKQAASFSAVGFICLAPDHRLDRLAVLAEFPPPALVPVAFPLLLSRTSCVLAVRDSEW